MDVASALVNKAVLQSDSAGNRIEAAEPAVIWGDGGRGNGGESASRNVDGASSPGWLERVKAMQKIARVSAATGQMIEEVGTEGHIQHAHHVIRLINILVRCITCRLITWRA